MNDFRSALEQQNPGAVKVLVNMWWPERFLSIERVMQLSDRLHGGSIFATSQSELESELSMLRDIANYYAKESLK